MTLFNEPRNLVSWARNRCAEFAMKSKYDKLLFIDADIQWQPEQIFHLLRSKKRIVGGTYPLKVFPIRLNYGPIINEHTPRGEYDAFEYFDKVSDEAGEFEVFNIPTGFLKIDVDVFEEMAPHMKKYHHRDPMKQELEYERMFFPVEIDESGNLNTEDWGFCHEARNLGLKLYMNKHCVVDHVGKHTYSATIPLEQSYHKLNVNEDHSDLAKEELEPHPFKGWPRNLSCFCGSGKKFKRCHEETLPAKCPKKFSEVLAADFKTSLAHVQQIHDGGNIYKLEKPLF